jgi:hypothetical protein
LTTETTAETILDVMSEQGHVYELSLKVKTRDDFKTLCRGTKFMTAKALARSNVADPNLGSCAFLTRGSRITDPTRIFSEPSKLFSGHS